MANENTTNPQTIITEEHIENVSSLLRKLKEQANEAYKANDVFMLGIYSELVKLVSPVCNKAMARLERQDKAEINKRHKNLKLAARSDGQPDTKKAKTSRKRPDSAESTQAQ